MSSPNDNFTPTTVVPSGEQVPLTPPKTVGGDADEYTDGRLRWDWQSKYPPAACKQMRVEAFTLLAMLGVSLCVAGASLSFAGENISYPAFGLELWISSKLIATFFVGCVGGVIFSMKWLIHAAAKGKWHLDRRYWRLMVPVMGGVYACVVLTLFASGFTVAQPASQSGGMASTAALAFLVGYFSDGVSGLLSNIANAVFGTLNRK